MRFEPKHKYNTQFFFLNIIVVQRTGRNNSKKKKKENISRTMNIRLRVLTINLFSSFYTMYVPIYKCIRRTILW